jgi:hypothetical protein
MGGRSVSIASSSFEELLAALQRAPKTATEKELDAWIAPEVKSIPAADLSELIASLASLRRVLVRTREVSLEILSEDVVAAMESAGIAIPPDLFPAAAERLASLLKLESLSVLETKGQELKAEYEHSFCDCRIFTDLRPVFGVNVKDAPDAMLIVHSLKMGYHDSDENKHRDFHVALDDSDLRSLREAIERAEAKAESLKSGLSTAGIRILQI